MGSKLGQFKPKIIKLVFVASTLLSVASLLSMQHQGVRAKTGCRRIRIICQSAATCPVCEISSRPIDNVYVKSSWSLSNFQNFVYNVQ
jgi:hypothetical protein